MKGRFKGLILFILLSFSSVGFAQLRIGYYPDYRLSMYNQIDYTKLTHLYYFSYSPSDAAANMPNTGFFTASNFATVKARALLVNPSIKIIIVTGGAGGGLTGYFSTILASAALRVKMANKIIGFIATNNLDGWDMDWEFPASTGTDKANHATFLTLMRGKLDSLSLVQCKKLTMSIAVGGETNRNESNPTHADYVNTTAAFINVLDYVNIMSYDAYMSCHPTYTNHSPLAFAQQAVAAYSGSTLGTPSSTFNWPKSKLIVGVPFYGYNSGGTASTYSTINSGNTAAPYNTDVTGGYGYNGCPTIKTKMDYVTAQGLAGIVIWELGQDLPTANTYSLLGCIGSYATTLGWTTPSSTNPCNLPVELFSFEAKRSGDQVAITWVTATEKNSDRFEVQRSIDGIAFQSVNSTPAKGTSVSLNYYSSTDLYPGSGLVYYRLAQYDIGGKLEYSDVVSVSATSDLAVRLLPNPFSNEVYVQFLNIQEYNDAIVSISSLEGKELFYKHYVAGEVTGITLGESLSSGTYIVKITSEGKSTVQKMIKQ